MRVIMTGGGTGGHIYPAIAIADEIKSRFPDSEILFVGTDHGMEKDLVPGAGYDIRFITVKGFDRKNLLKNVSTLRELMKGISESGDIIRDFNPDAVIGTGGYVCGPVVWKAAKMGIPTYIHEQNASPGLTNKMLAKNVDRIFVSFEEAKKYFKVPEDKMKVVGNPIRKRFFTVDRLEAREKIGLQEEFTVLCFGGSLGARKINETVLELAGRIKNVKGIRLIFVTGKRHYEEITDRLKKPSQDSGSNLTVMPYINNMYDYLKGCDLIICRSGALTVSEVTACGRASIMIPSPNVTGNHQYYNAKVVADRGGALLIEEKDLSAGVLERAILSLMNDPEKLRRMEKQSAALAVEDSAGDICRSIWPDEENEVQDEQC